MEERGLKQVDIMKKAEKYKAELNIKMPKNYLSQYVNGKSTPDNLRLVLLSKVLGVSEAWLMGYDVPQFDYESNEETPPLIDKTVETMKQLEEPRQEKVLNFAKNEKKEQEEENKRIISLTNNDTSNLPEKEYTYTYYDNAVSAGTGQYLTDGKQETITLPIKCDADFVVPVCGDSMEPEFHDYDYVFIKNTYDLYDGDIGVFILDGEAYIKELRIDDEGAFLHSLNPQYRDKPLLAESDFRIAGKVIGRYSEKDEINK
ncbi:S24 family peptidase [Lactococcus lactis]